MPTLGRFHTLNIVRQTSTDWILDGGELGDVRLSKRDADRPLHTGEAVSVFVYTGEDGYEISVPAHAATRIWNTLLEDERVRPIGLGARDSLRLEAGLPLYGHDLDETVSPIEAGLNFAVGKSRREAGDYFGADRIAKELAGELSRVRVNLKVLEALRPAKAPRSPTRLAS